MTIAAGHPLGLLAVTCWCERRVVWVSPADVVAGITGRCKHPDCLPPERNP